MGLSGFEPPPSPGLAPKSGETERRANAPAFVPGVTQLFGVGTSSRSVKVSHFSPVDASYQAGKEAKEASRRGASEALLTPQCFQISLTPRMFPVWDYMVGIFARKILLNSGRVLSTLSC